MKNCKCKKCDNFKVVYVERYFMFWEEKQGYCDACQNMVGEKDVCKFYSLKSDVNTTIIQSLDIAIEDLNVLQQIYRE